MEFKCRGKFLTTKYYGFVIINTKYVENDLKKKKRGTNRERQVMKLIEYEVGDIERLKCLGYIIQKNGGFVKTRKI